MPNPYFNATYYLKNNPDVDAAGYTINTAEQHYLQYGANEAFNDTGTLDTDQRKPAPWFDVQFYLLAYPDLQINGVTPSIAFQHFTTHGINEGRMPMSGTLLDRASLGEYASQNPDLLIAFGIGDSESLTESQESALANHFYLYGYMEDRPGAPDTPTTPDTSRITLEAEGWSSGLNNVSFILEFDSKIQLNGIGLLGGGVATLSAQTTTTGGLTTVVANMSLSNGKPVGSIGVDLIIPSTLQGSASVAIKDFMINRIKYPDVSATDSSGVIEFKLENLLEAFTLIDESPFVDSSGYDTFYKHINDVFSLPTSKAGLIEAGSVTDAYLHIDEGDSFVFDHDTFVLRADNSGNYRLKFSPEDSSLFNSNVISWLYEADGSREGLVMNLIGNESSFVDGSLYSSSFSLQAGEDKFLSLSMRWRSDDVWGVADGPAPYQVELVELVGVSDAADWLF